MPVEAPDFVKSLKPVREDPQVRFQTVKLARCALDVSCGLDKFGDRSQHKVGNAKCPADGAEDFKPSHNHRTEFMV